MGGKREKKPRPESWESPGESRASREEESRPMPKNKGKGGKNRRRGKNENEETKRQLEFKEPGQEYSQVVRMLGNGRCECYCFDGVMRLGQTLCGNQPVRRVFGDPARTRRK